MPNPLQVSVVGLGPIGLAAAKAVVADPQMTLAGLVDVSPDLVGSSPVDGGPKVTETLQAADVAIVCTTSDFDKMEPLLRAAARQKTHVVSSCEEMLWPTYRHADLAKELNAVATEAGVAFLGTGVNPGFVLDTLPVVLSSMVLEVSAVRARRRVDAGTRRKPLQAKVGATMTVEAFDERRRANTIGHRGMAESVALVASGLGRTVEAGSVEETLEPVVAKAATPSALGEIAPGQVAGIHNVGRWRGDGLDVELDLIMSVGWDDPHDAVELDGPVPLRMKLDGGTPGDSATVAALVNAARVLPHINPGIRTMLDLGHQPAARSSA
ncbi:MAG: dihydrodipicolinate reductase [Planctomycetota bacterium]